MRLIKVVAPNGIGEQVAKTAFSVGIERASIHQVEEISSGGIIEKKDVIDIETSTPKGKRFVDALLAADYYNRQDFSFSVRGALSIISRENIRELTVPLPETGTDILEELFQFSHLTYGFIGRVFIAASILAYGLIQENLLLIIAGLLFLPLLPLLLSISFGFLAKEWKLLVQGVAALLTALVLLILGGMLVAGLSAPPLKYSEFNSLGVSFLISLAVGIAAGLANIDDAGKREMIGLAATAQIAIVPVWFGICFIFGFPATANSSEIKTRAISLLLNVSTIIVASLVVYALIGASQKLPEKVKK